MKRILTLLTGLPLVAACSAAGAAHPALEPSGSRLNHRDLTAAEAVARHVIADQGAVVSSASAIARRGKVRNSNTGHPCTSGRELRIKLIGDFPHTVTTGHFVPSGSPMPDFTIRAMIITADARTGRTCLIAVQTAENGKVKQLPGGTPLPVG